MTDPADNDPPVCTIDAHDRIAFASPAWIIFWASQNREWAETDCIGLPLWRFVGPGEIRLLWELLYRRVRAMGAAVFVPMRVDTPTQRRLIEVELRPLSDRGIEHICERIWSEERPPAALLDPTWPRDARTLRCCAWCNRIQVRLGVWQELEDAQIALGIEATPTLPALTADACVTCKQSLLKTFPVRVA
jgi:hypothetical protein